jgi:hypothetical protein
MKIIELVLDENNIDGGVNAISLVERPAIESNFIALSEQIEVRFAEVKDKMLLIGPALIPNKTIYRKEKEKEFYVYFSEDTVRKASQLFLKMAYQGKSTLEHDMKLSGLTVVESWIVEDSEKDKSAVYGMSQPKGTWMVCMKVDNEEVWNEEVKQGKVNGFSIEGYFIDKTELSIQEDLEEIEAAKKLEAIKNLLSNG